MIKQLLKVKYTVNTYLYFGLEFLLKTFLYIVPKKKNQVLFGAWFGQKYCDNTKYVYEFLLNTPKLKVIWYTRNKSVYENLKNENKPAVLADTFKGIWAQLRTKLFVSTVQMADFNSLFVTHCKYLDLGHGHPIKDCGDITRNRREQISFKLQQLYVEYYSAVCGPISADIAIRDHNTPVDNIRYTNFARNDFFFDESLRTEKIKIPFEYKGKTIVYMPTHRSEGRVKMNMDEILDLSFINNICRSTDSIFIIKKHFYHRNETEDLTSYDRILDLSDSSIDPQLFLSSADILVTDYSACYVDYLLLDRPIIFYQYDYNEFQQKERSLIIPFERINIAPKPNTRLDFNMALQQELTDDTDRYHVARTEFIKNYFCKPMPHHGREDVTQIISELLELNI